MSTIESIDVPDFDETSPVVVSIGLGFIAGAFLVWPQGALVAGSILFALIMVIMVIMAVANILSPEIQDPTL